MLVGFDAKRFYHNKSGLGNYSRSLIQMLEQFTDIQLRLYSPHVTGPKQSNHQTHFYNKFPLNRQWFIRNQIHQDGIDLFHGLSNEIPLGLKIPTVVTVHDVLFKRYPEDYSAFDNFIYDRKTRYAIQNATAVVCPSETTKADLIKFYDADPNKIHVIFETCAEAFSNPTERRQNVSEYFLILATAQKRKNLSVVLECYANDTENVLPPAVLLGINIPKFENAFASFKPLIQKGRIKIPGYVEEKDLVDYYYNASAIVYPSHWEGFGIPILEAQSANSPLILADNPCFREIGATGALFFDPLCPMSLKNQMLSLSNTPELRDKLLLAAQENLTRFEPATIAKNYQNLYQKLV